MRTIGAIALLVALLILPACIDESYSPAEQYCVALCDGLDRCWEITNHHFCVRDCLAEPWLESASDATLGDLADCIEAQGCKKYLSGAGFQGCWEDASDEDVPAEQCRIICEAYVLQAKECGKTYTRAACLDLQCDPSTGAMAGVVACAADRDCDPYPGCVAAAISGGG